MRFVIRYLLILGILVGLSISILGLASGTYITAEEELIEVPTVLKEEERIPLGLVEEIYCLDFQSLYICHSDSLSRRFGILLSEQIHLEKPLIDSPDPPPEVS